MPEISLHGARIHYALDDFTRPWAPGETVLLAHGYARDHRFWHRWVPLVGDRYRVLRPDLRGHGLSGPLGPDDIPTLDGLAADVVGLLDALGLARVHFVGESLAGVIGLWLGAFYPERVASLVLLSTPVKVSEEGKAAFRQGAPSWAEAFDRLSPSEWARRTMGHRFDPGTTDPGYIEWAIAAAAATPLESLRRYAALIEGLDLSGGIPAVKRPTLLVSGGSKLAPPEQARFLAERIPGARLEVVPEARHLVGYALPEQTAALARAFWEDLPPLE